ncbi:hypothetical protein C2G38_2117515 [Gigaspora rosea]|uniref:Uncharacterized protein n=1 Tax=Gigaspora rosea TaxID=44941 RepID=A0A397U7X8_9GLOM|nr:hypothetical protein C2G38_2117515 [Gigaspora rosea]
MARARNDCTKHATATRVLQIQNMSSQLTLQQIQIPRQMQYFQQISTNPNMVQPLQTPNILHVQIPQQMNNGLVMQSLNQQQQMEKQLHPVHQQMPYHTPKTCIHVDDSQSNHKI